MTADDIYSRVCARTALIDDPGDLLGFLAEASDIAWLRRGEGVVGLGVFEHVTLGGVDDGADWWAEYSDRIEHSTELPGEWGVGPLAFGSFAFDPRPGAAQSVMVVPRIVIGRRAGVCWMTVVGDATENLDAVTLPDQAPSPAAPGAVTLSSAGPDADAYGRLVDDLVARIGDRDSALVKVVLARAVRAAAQAPIEPRWLAARLASDYPSCWTFHVEGLVGASPEMLMRAQGGLATSRVLAGTIRREDPAKDAALAEALAGSGKDLEEHELAVASVAEAQRPFCSGMNVPEAPFVLQLPNVMHLASDVTGVMDASVSSLRLAGRLHPSAAVCGTPTHEALATIAEVEGIDRGRYAGPVGWIDTAGDGEWALALRSGQLDPADPRSITLYAGCGIVGRSRSEAEIAETNAKLRPMLDALGVSADARS